MNPQIDGTQFGSITIAGKRYEHDVLIRLDGSIEKRKKKLSKKEFGTSHLVSGAEAEHIFEPHARLLIFGSGQYGRAELSPQAQAYFDAHDCDVRILPTPEAIDAWNECRGAVVGLFHVTC